MSEHIDIICEEERDRLARRVAELEAARDEAISDLEAGRPGDALAYLRGMKRNEALAEDGLSQTAPVVTYPGTATGTQEETCVTHTVAARGSEGTPTGRDTARADVSCGATEASGTSIPKGDGSTGSDAKGTSASPETSGSTGSGSPDALAGGGGGA